MKRTSTDSELPARSAPQMSSIFGQSASQAPKSTSAFPPTSSLFGDLATSKPEQKPVSGSSLSTGAGGQSKPEASSNLFSDLGFTPQPQAMSSGGGGGLFGSAHPATTQSQGTSIFANTTTTPAPSLFSNTATTSAPPLFANHANNPAPFATSSLFSQPQPAQNQAGQPQQQTGQSIDSAPQRTQPAYFNSLLEKSKKRAHDANVGPGFGNLPSLQLGLGDIGRRARELGGTEQQAQRDGAADSRA